ncbi:MAG: hypothetical protein PGN13_10270 [Patulibacter minatonensis]
MRPESRPNRPPLRPIWGVGGVFAIAGVLWLAYGPGFLGIDALWSVVWGRDLVHLSALEASGTTTPHLLSNLLGALLAPFGSSADRALSALTYLGAGTLVVGAAATAREIAGAGAAVVAGLLMASREQLLYATRSGFLDVFVAALVIWAVFLLVRSRGERVRGAGLLLFLAGLLRPEPWVVLAVLAFLHWRRAGGLDRLLAALVVAVPAIWALGDLILSGDALYSLHHTTEVVELFRAGNDIPTGWQERIVSIPRNVAHAPGPELLVLGLLVAALAVLPGPGMGRLRVRLTGERLAGPAVGQLGVVVLVAVVLVAVVAGESLIGTLLFSRFLLPFAALTVVLVAVGLTFAAQALLGRRAVPGLAVATVVLLVVAAPFLRSARTTTDPERARYEAARAVIAPGVPCGPVVVPGVNLQAAVAVWTGRRGGEVLPAAELAELPEFGTFVDAQGSEPEKLLLDPSFPQRRVGAQGGTLVRTGGGWTLRATCAR